MCEFFCPALISAFINVETVGNDSGVFVQISIIAAYMVAFVFVSVPSQMTVAMLDDFDNLASEEESSSPAQLRKDFLLMLEEVKIRRKS